MSQAAKTIPQIFRDNICTFFNLLNVLIAVALAAVGAWKNMLFILIIFLNTVIGIVQEIKAKRQIDRLTLLSRPNCEILRDGQKKCVPPEEIETGDLLSLSPGAVICTDCIIQSGRMEINESVLTGETEPVDKSAGDKLLSGSSVISGKCTAKVLCRTEESFASKMLEDVKRISTSRSELLSAMKKVTKFTGFLIVPLGVLLFVQAFFLRGQSAETAVISTSAGLLGMLPKGLVLLISIGLAVGVVRLSKKNVLIRQLHSLENLAHCDVVCLDKTGTLTEGRLSVEKVYVYDQRPLFEKLMATYLKHTDDTNATYQALAEHFSKSESLEVKSTLPFSSERKYSAVSLQDGRVLVLGAPEKLCTNIPDDIQTLLAQGKRVLSVGLSDGEISPERIRPIAAIVISDRLRESAVKTIRYFYEQGIDVKVISGDHPLAASALAKQAGIREADRCVQADLLDDQALKLAAGIYTVFGRVTPSQKQKLISALQQKGHRVAMIGDGVNDLQAMRQADCSAAIGNGSDAARQTAQMVLLDSDFSVLRDVISEGRRVVNNLTKSAGVFFIKTIYSLLLCAACLVLGTNFPFIPIQITLIDAVIEAFPAFFMSFEKNDRKICGSFLSCAVRAALPNGIFIFIACTAILLQANHLQIDRAQQCLWMYLTVGFVSLAGVVKASFPMNKLHCFLSGASIVGFAGAVFMFSSMLQLPRLSASLLPLLILTVLPGFFLCLMLKIPAKKSLKQ